MSETAEAIATGAAWAAAVVTAAAGAMVLAADVAAEQGAALEDLAAGLPGDAAAAGTWLAGLGAVVRQVAREGEGAAPAFEAALAVAEPEEGAAAVVAVARGYLLAGLAVAVLRASYAARQDATAARARFAGLASSVVERVGEVLGFAAGEALSDLAGETVTTLSRVAADRAPLVTVETGVSLPSVVLAWRLYGDAERSTELVGRNRVATAALMPVRFEAVAPAAGRR